MAQLLRNDKNLKQFDSSYQIMTVVVKMCQNLTAIFKVLHYLSIFDSCCQSLKIPVKINVKICQKMSKFDKNHHTKFDSCCQSLTLIINI